MLFDNGKKCIAKHINDINKNLYCRTCKTAYC